MGDLDEVLKKFNKWIVPIIGKLNIKIRQEASGFANTWSGLRELKSVTSSGFDVKIREEHSGFLNIWSGLNDIERDIETLQIITNSGFDTIHGDLLKKQYEEISGFSNIWSGLRSVEADIETLQTITNSGFDVIHVDLLKKQRIEASGFRNIQSGIQMLRDGVSITLCLKQNILGVPASATLGCFDRWTLYIATSGANSIVCELSPNNAVNWFVIPESPLFYSGVAQDVIEFGYDATNIRLTGNSGTGVTAFVRGCW